MIAGKPGGRVVLARHCGQAAAGDVEQAITGLVAEPVIDTGEAVEIDDDQIELARLAILDGGNGAIEPIGEERAIGQAGDPVIDRIIEKLLLGTAPARHIGQGSDAAQRPPVGTRQDAAAQLEPAIGSIAAA